MSSLVIDCSGHVISASLALTSGETISKRLDQKYGQAETLAALVRAVIDESSIGEVCYLNQLVVCRGPGGFTGLRVAISFAKGLEAALPKVSLLTISNDQYWRARWNLELSGRLEGAPFVAIDTRRKDFYGKWLHEKAETSWHVYSPSQINSDKSTVGLGNASHLLNLDRERTFCEEMDCVWLSKQSLQSSFIEQYCSHNASPLYVRPPAISKPGSASI